MKSKQLANVLIKVIGLYICLDDIPSIIAGILAFFWRGVGDAKWADETMRYFAFSIGSAMQLVVGILLIIMSRKLAGFWFKDENE